MSPINTASPTNDVLLNVVRPAVTKPAAVAPPPKVKNQSDAKEAEPKAETQKFADKLKEAEDKRQSSAAESSENHNKNEETDAGSDAQKSDDKARAEMEKLLAAGERTEELEVEIEWNPDAEADLAQDAVVVATGFVFENLPKEAKQQGVDLELAATGQSVRPELVSRLQQSLESGDGEITESDTDLTLAQMLDKSAARQPSSTQINTQGDIMQVQEARQDPRVAQQAQLNQTEMSVPTRVGAKDWGESMAGRITLMVNQRINSARIQLTPPELGPIEVRVNVNHDQASVQFISHSAQVRDALEQSLPRLREMLESAGFSLADSDVSGQERQDSGDGESQEDAETLAANESEEQEEILQRETTGLVDQFV